VEALIALPGQKRFCTFDNRRDVFSGDSLVHGVKFIFHGSDRPFGLSRSRNSGFACLHLNHHLCGASVCQLVYALMHILLNEGAQILFRQFGHTATS